MTMGWKLLATLAVVAFAGCSVGSVFLCDDSAQCTQALGGACQPSGFCSYDDASCASGQRYGSLAPEELENRCAPPIEGLAEGASSGGSDDDPEPGHGTHWDGVADSGSDGATTGQVDDPADEDGDTDDGDVSEDDAGSTSDGGQAAGSSSDDAAQGQEICDGLDNDGDGLIDEGSAVNASCDGCTLSQIDGVAWWACDGAVDYDDATAACAGFGAELGRVMTMAEMSWLVSQSPGSALADALRVDGTDLDEEGTWRWADGSAADLTDFWAGSEPQGGITQNCTIARGDVAPGLHDYTCTGALRFACSAP